MRHWALGWVVLVAACGGGGGDDGPIGPCGANGECPAGYECHADDNMCYRSSGSKPDAGADGPIGARPNTTLSEKPSALGNVAAVRFVFSSNVAGATFVCSVDGKPFAACTSPLMTTVEEGQHSFAVAAVSGTLQDDTPETWTFKVDLTPPDTSITDGPSGSVNNSEAQFSFTSTETGSTFECRFDGGAFSACTSGSTFTGFTIGGHTFEVRAVDPAGNPDPSPAPRSWTVDQTSPQTTIGSGPGALTNDPDADFVFSSDKPGSTFVCKLDTQTAATCGSPKSYTGLADGRHTFTVVATDSAGNPDPSPATFVWTIDTVPPVITLDSGPAEGSTSGPAVTFNFSSPENAPAKSGGGEGVAPPPPAVTFECQLDTGAIAACDSPKAYTGLPSGTRVFQVRGVDGATNRSAFVKRTWTVDSSKPVVTVTAPKDGDLTKGSGQITFTGSETGMTFTCTLDGTAVSPCTSPVAYSFTTDARHTFVISGTVRGVTSDPVTVGWEADGVAPTATIDNPASDGVTTGPSVDVKFSSEVGATFQCKVGSIGAFNPCTSPLAVLLSDGPASVTVHASDVAGNVSADVTRSWTVDATGPVVTMTVTPLAGGATRANASVTYNSVESGVTFECRAYIQGTTAPAYAACASTGITLGSYGFKHGDKVTIDVRGRDTFKNAGAAATTNATIDEQGPQLKVTAPSGTIGKMGTLTFTSDETGTFSCSIADATGAVVVGPSACTTASGLDFTLGSSGSYTAKVSGTDGVGNPGSTTGAFAVDADGPTMNAVMCSSTFHTGTVKCNFSATDASGVSGYFCSLDGAGAAACMPGVTLAEVSQGRHIVSVYAVDKFGNVGSPVSAPQVEVFFARGHAALLGHDFNKATTQYATLIANAVQLSYVFDPKIAFRRNVRVMAWESDRIDPVEVATVRQALDATVNYDYKRFDDPNLLPPGQLLTGQDVLLIYDQNDWDAVHTTLTLPEVGKIWGDELSFFLKHGGVIIVLDGRFKDGTQYSRTYRLLQGAALLNPIVKTLETSDGSNCVPAGAASDPLRNGLSNGYIAQPNSVSYVLSGTDARWALVFTSRDQQSWIVMHFLSNNG